MRATLTLVSSLALLPAAAWAQATTEGGGQPMLPAGQPQAAEQCRDDLRAFGARVDEEGYWLTGWRAGAATGLGAAPPPAATTTAAEPTAAPAAPAAPVGVGPWGDVGWQRAPAMELGTLYDAAYILAGRGDEQGCQTVLAALDQAYGEYATQLREAGVDPSAVSGWRAQEIVAARPVSELGRSLRFDDIAGTDLRNPSDEYLGSVEDVLLDPETGGIAYAVVERGSFLGFGGESVAVPWERLRATPGLNMFVIEADETVISEAPKVEPGSIGDRAQFEARRQEIDQYWQQHERS